MAQRKISNVNREFKGVFIKAEYWLAPELTTTEILFITEIDSLSANNQGCFASNSYLAGFFGLSSSRASQVVTSLINKGYLTASYDRTDTGQVKKRTLMVVNKLSTSSKNSKGGSKKTVKGYLENCEESNTSINTIEKDNNNNKETPEFQIPIDQNQDQNQEPKYEDPVTLWRQNTQFNRPSDTQQIIDGITDFTNLGATHDEANGIVSLAVHQTLNSNANMNYLNTILRNWRDAKVTTVEMAKKAQEQHRQQTSRKSSNYGQTGTPSTAKQPDYDLGW